jgi:hypothetical protein
MAFCTHSSTLTSINNLASVLSHQGKYGQVEEMYRQTLGLRDAVLGKEHASTMSSVNNLPNVLSRRKRFSEADALYQSPERLRESLTPRSSHRGGVERTSVAVSDSW